MFKLLRLAIYALVGYAAYQFVMDLVHGAQQQEPQKAQAKSKGRPTRAGARASAPSGGTKAVAGARMTAAARAGGEGKKEETHNPDGGTVRHRVGRGVV
jgi:hypothetical protein